MERDPVPLWFRNLGRQSCPPISGRGAKDVHWPYTDRGRPGHGSRAAVRVLHGVPITFRMWMGTGSGVTFAEFGRSTDIILQELEARFRLGCSRFCGRSSRSFICSRRSEPDHLSSDQWLWLHAHTCAQRLDVASRPSALAR